METSFLESQKKKTLNDRLYWSPLNINRALAGYIPSQRLWFFLSVLTEGMLQKVLQVKQWRMTHIVFSPWYFSSCLRFMTVSCFFFWFCSDCCFKHSLQTMMLRFICWQYFKQTCSPKCLFRILILSCFFRVLEFVFAKWKPTTISLSII